MQAITSREDKMMLKAGKFAGGEAELSEAAGSFWSALAGIILPRVIAVSGYERVIKGTTFQIGKDPDVFAECSFLR